MRFPKLEVLTGTKIGKKEFSYIALMGGATVLSFIRTMVFGKYLSPQFMGYYSVIMTVASYAVFLQCGLLSGLNRELPVCLGRGEEEYSSRLVGETTVSLLTLLLTGFLFYYIIIDNISFKDSSLRYAFFLAGLIAFSNAFFQIIMLRLRAEQRVMSFSTLQMVSSAGILLLGIIAIHFLSYKGAVFAIIFVEISSFLVISKIFLSPVNYFFFAFKDIFYLIRIGFPMMLAGVLINLQLSMDRLFLIKNMSATDIGIYQIGLLPLTFGIANSGIIGQYVGPRLLYRFGQGVSLRYIFNRLFMVSLITIVTMAMCLPLLIPAVRFVINHWLPDYQASVPLIFIFYLGAIFTSANLFGIVLNAANRQMLLLYGTALVTLISFIGYIIVSKYNMPIKWYAYVNVMVQIISFFFLSGISYYYVKKST